MTNIDLTDLSDEDRGVVEVSGPSGSHYEVLHEKERVYWENVVKKYLSDYKFTNISDLQDLDRVVASELLIYRYNLWVNNEQDYWGQTVDIKELNSTIKDRSAELRQIKKALGIDKSSREKDSAESVAKYIENLRRRAHEFGVMRNEQSVKAITLFMELSSLITLHDNCTEEERKQNHIEIYDIMDWIRTKAIPEFEAIDEEFRKTKQKYWVSEM